MSAVEPNSILWDGDGDGDGDGNGDGDGDGDGEMVPKPVKHIQGLWQRLRATL